MSAGTIGNVFSVTMGFLIILGFALRCWGVGGNGGRALVVTALGRLMVNGAELRWCVGGTVSEAPVFAAPCFLLGHHEFGIGNQLNSLQLGTASPSHVVGVAADGRRSCDAGPLTGIGRLRRSMNKRALVIANIRRRREVEGASWLKIFLNGVKW